MGNGQSQDISLPTLYPTWSQPCYFREKKETSPWEEEKKEVYKMLSSYLRNYGSLFSLNFWLCSFFLYLPNLFNVLLFFKIKQYSKTFCSFEYLQNENYYFNLSLIIVTFLISYFDSKQKFKWRYQFLPSYFLKYWYLYTTFCG